MTLRLDPDPTDIRKRLAASRERGMSFDGAWEEATGFRKLPPGDHIPLLKFMRKHFEAAYYNHAESPLGRCLIPERDVSSALAPVGSVAPPVERGCRWGSGCKRPAECGQFGAMWCGEHGAELARIGAALANDQSNPRRDGNTAIANRNAA